MLKKGQGGLNAAILVAVIAAVIIIYILFLPTEDREELLEQDSDYSGSTGGGSSDEETIVLLSEGVGRLDPVGLVRDKEIPNINIFETTNSKVLANLNPVYVKNGWFDTTIKVVEFEIEDLENTENLLLSFSAQKRKGILSIKLNGGLVYEFDINSLNVEPIKLKKRSLKEVNELEFSVSGVGGKFWTTNEYALDDVRIIGDINDLSRQESQNVFTLSDSERQNVEDAKIRFIPYCLNVNAVGTLDVFINNRNIFSAVPICNDVYEQDIPIGVLSAGQNKVIFKTSKGSYSIEQIKLSFEEKDTPEAVYYFEVNSSTYDKVVDDDYDSFIRLRFVSEERKRGDINLNDHLMRIDTDKKEYSRNIDAWIEEDNNFIKITPNTILDIVELEVVLEEN